MERSLLYSDLHIKFGTLARPISLVSFPNFFWIRWVPRGYHTLSKKQNEKLGNRTGCRHKCDADLYINSTPVDYTNEIWFNPNSLVKTVDSMAPLWIQLKGGKDRDDFAMKPREIPRKCENS